MDIVSRRMMLHSDFSQNDMAKRIKLLKTLSSVIKDTVTLIFFCESYEKNTDYCYERKILILYYYVDLTYLTT